MSSLRVLHVTQVYPPFLQASGQAVKVAAVARHLALRGHHVTVLTAGHKGTAAQLSDEQFEVVYLWPMIRYRAITVSPGVLRFCLRRLREFDIVHVYGLYDLLGPVVAAFCRRWRIPYVLEPLGMFRPMVRNVTLKR